MDLYEALLVSLSIKVNLGQLVRRPSVGPSVGPSIGLSIGDNHTIQIIFSILHLLSLLQGRSIQIALTKKASYRSAMGHISVLRSFICGPSS